MVDFGSLTVSQQTIKKIKNEFKDKDYLASEVVNKYLKDNNGSGSIKDVAQFMADFGEEKDAQVYLVAAALMDTNRDGKIEQAEYDKLKNLSKVCTQSTVDGTDLQALFDQLDVADTKLLDKISQNINSSLKQTDDAGSPVTGKSGVVRNSDGTFSLTVEKYRSGKVQDDGQGGKRYPNGTYWGIITNAYPNLSEAQKKQVYEMLGDLNGFDWQNHTLHPGDKIKLPVLEFDKSGNIVGYKAKSNAETNNNQTSSAGNKTASKATTATTSTKPVGQNAAEKGAQAATTSTKPVGQNAAEKGAQASAQATTNAPKMVNNRGSEAEYEIKNADGSVTRFTVPAGETADIKNATGSIITEKVVNGKMQLTEEKDGVKTVYTYSGSKVDGKPTTIQTIEENGLTSSFERRKYDSNGRVITEKHETEYKAMLSGLQKLLDSSIAGLNEKYDKFKEYAKKCFNSTDITDAQKAELFNQLIDMAQEKAGQNIEQRDKELAYYLVQDYGDSSFISTEQKADTIKELLSNENTVFTPECANDKNLDIPNGFVFPTMEKLIAEGNLDKALELETKYNEIFSCDGEEELSDKVAGADWAQMTADMYAVAAKEGRLGEISSKSQYSPFEGIQDNTSEGTETGIITELFNNLGEQLPEDIDVPNATKELYETQYLSGSLENNLKNILKSSLNNETKAYLLKQVIDSSDFIKKFRDMKASKQEDLFEGMIAQIAKYVDVK